ncbi:MAG TPA: ATP-binding protein [Acidimicrobiia bacterium]|nr:ATP-binding protein [Acidimicrobiia bacterium]
MTGGVRRETRRPPARDADTLPVSGIVAALASVGAASDLVDAFDFATGLLARVTGGPAIGCLLEGERLRVVRHPGIDREQLGRLVGHDDFRRLAADWRDRPVPPERSVTIHLGTDGRFLFAPVVADRWLGVLAAHATDARMVELVEGLAAHVANVARRDALAATLAHREAELDAAIQALPLPVLTVDGHGRLTRVNPPACELFGLSGSFDVGRPVAGLLGVPDVEALLTGDDTAFEREVRLGRPPRAFRAVVSRVADGADTMARMVALEDVETGQEKTRLTADFVAVMAHELRTPLTVISGFAQTLAARDDTLDPEQRRQFLTAIAAQSGRLAQIIEDLLFLSRERRGEQMVAARVPVEIDRVVESVVAEVLTRDPDRQVEVVHSAGDLTVATDRGIVEQVLRHLLDNALKFSDGPVTVEVRPAPDDVTLAVSDEGPGILSGDLARVFEPFVQLDGSATRRHGGTGMGLYVVRRLTEILGGYLECDSRLGVGSRFGIVLPRRAEVASSMQPPGGDVLTDQRA